MRLVPSFQVDLFRLSLRDSLRVSNRLTPIIYIKPPVSVPVSVPVRSFNTSFDGNPASGSIDDCFNHCINLVKEADKVRAGRFGVKLDFKK